MNPDSLDKYLRAYTESELRYKNGCRNTTFDNCPTVMQGGKSVKLMHFPQNVATYQAHGPVALSLKKQSRFSAIPTHMHSWIEINYMYSGSCPQVINDSSYTLQKGQVILIDCDTPHSTARLEENDIMVNLLISHKYLNQNFFNRMSQDSIVSQFFINALDHNARHNNYIVFHSENSRKLPLFFAELMCEILDPSMNSTDIVDSLITLILCELINIYRKDWEQEEHNQSQASIIAILRYIESNYKTCTLKSTAAFFNLNPNYLSTLLKQKLNISYKELVQRQRLTRAAQLLLNTDMPIAAVTHQAGYENMNFFYKKFKERYGCSPSEYRKTKLE